VESEMMKNAVLKMAGTLLLVLAASAYALPGQQSNGAATPQVSAAQSSAQDADHTPPGVRNPRYRLSRSDQVSLDFPLVAEFNQTVIVQPDGFITLKDVGDLQVLGMTVPELGQAVRAAYAKILHDPVVTVDLKDFQKPYFTALGEVTKPGKYELREDITVAEALALAGGLSTAAKHSQVVLFRRVSGELTEVKTLNIKRMLHTKDLSEDVHMQPGDLLYVPTSILSKIKPYLPGYGVSAFGPLP
jgi:polysaccharide biosynthesis/export protein